jgi:hypothetical protein
VGDGRQRGHRLDVARHRFDGIELGGAVVVLPPQGEGHADDGGQSQPKDFLAQRHLGGRISGQER